jgi:hypothetical protein
VPLGSVLAAVSLALFPPAINFAVVVYRFGCAIVNKATKIVNPAQIANNSVRRRQRLESKRRGSSSFVGVSAIAAMSTW